MWQERLQINGENSGTLETFMKKSNSSKLLLPKVYKE